MKLRSRFLYFVILLHLVLTVLAYVLVAYNKMLFFGIQLLVVFSAVVSYRLYRDFVKPLDILAAGVESIHDRDFGCTLIKTGHDELDRLIDVYNRMIEQLRRERLTQQELNYFLERLIEASPLGIIIFDLDQKISLLNPAAQKILGVAQAAAIGRPLRSVAHGPLADLDDLPPGMSRIARINGIQTYRCHKSQFMDRGFHRQFLLLDEVTGEIIETQKKAYEKVIRAMSHEVNNSVGAINSILTSIHDYLMQSREGDGDDYREAVAVAIERNSGLGRFMANYADVVRIPPPHKETHDLHRLLKSTQALLQRECLERNISWRCEPAAEVLDVEMDLNQMEQAVVNIVKNAIEAIDRDGTIIIRTTTAPRTLSIIDTGRGIDAESAAYLFTPFYTTKSDGQGIGLTLVREILTNHGFRFSLGMNADNMTEFKIVFGE